MPEYTHNQLLILHHLKRYGPITKPPNDSILRVTAAELGMKVSALTYQLRTLEAKCLVLRTYERPATRQFGAGASNNPLTRLELVDPNMTLPAIPQVYVDRQRKPTPLGIVIAEENEDLEERIEHRNHDEPSVESIVEALVDRALELQKQVDKLQNVIAGLNAENARLRQPKPQPHLSARVRDVLTDDQWDALRRKS
jgi:hypothetical protein